MFEVQKYVDRLKAIQARDLIAISELPKLTNISMVTLQKMFAGEAKLRVDVLRRLRDFVDGYEQGK